MEQKEFEDCMKYMDIVEVMIREKEAKEFVAKGEIEDALAYAYAQLDKKDAGGLRKMGTTLTLLYIHTGDAHIL